MHRLQIIPAVDVLEGRAVRLLRGDYDQVTVYADDPVEQAILWRSQGAGLVHVVDLEGARGGAPDLGLWQSLAEAGVPFQVGGGLRTADQARAALAAGASRVVMGTAAVWRPDVLAAVGDPARVVAAVDVRDGAATGAGWVDEGREMGAVLADLARYGVERLLVTGIGRDGTMEGPDVELLAAAVADGRFAVLASGGVGDLEDLRTVAALGCEAAVVGRALYEGRFSLSEAMEVGGVA
ncbi:MAG: 1-(5-phosphoribosyl)-5-[(5-phosphoribosylamino)methylideneamino] imidazole-4-carboxamide isomerase [Acidimicrobiia bacterium]